MKKLVAVILGFFFLLPLELSLRLLGVGEPPPSYWEKDLGKMEEKIGPKPEGAVRILNLGGSTVRGLPYGERGAFPRFLEEVLGDAVPSCSVQVINLGIHSVGTRVLKEIIREALRYEPDLLVLYTGHNEFLPGNLLPYEESAIREWLSNLRMYAVLRKAVLKIKGEAKSLPPKTVSRGGPLFQRVVCDYGANLGEIGALCREAGVPLLLLTVASNQRDWAPNASLMSEGKEERKAALEGLLKKGEREMAEGDLEEALSQFRKAREIDPSYAMLQYSEAQCLERVGAFEKARDGYVRAKDYDAIPWRVLSEFNRTIRSLWNENGIWGADVLGAFVEASPNGLLGYNLIVDNCHPTLEGNFIVAREILNAISGMGLFPAGVLDPSAVKPFEAYRERLDLPPQDVAKALEKTADYVRSPPFLRYGDAVRYYEKALKMDPALRPSILPKMAETKKAIRNSSGL